MSDPLVEKLDEVRNLLPQLAGFLTLIAKGIIPAPSHIQKEARELLVKIGDVVGAI